MNYLRLLTVAILLTSLCGHADEGLTKKEPTLSTNVEFDPLTVHGRYQYADEATATVEDEKILHDLLGPRKDFKDRIRRSARNR